MRVYILRLNGIEIVSENFRHAMRSAAVLLVPDTMERERLRKLDQAPALGRINALGSFYQLLRHLNERGDQLDFKIYEHSVGGPPGIETASRVLDFNEGTDPSYLVQAALWDIALHGCCRHLDEVAAGIEAVIKRDIAGMRAVGTDDGIVLNRLAWIEERMGGLKVIPAVGQPSGILDKLPRVAGSMFLEIAKEAFPDLAMPDA